MAKAGLAAILDSGFHQWHVIARDENSGHTQPTSAASRQAPGSVTSWPRLIINPAGITISAGSIRKVEGVVAMTTVQFFGTAANAPLATLTVDSTTGRVERLCEPS